jgi:hypothetical protein
MTSHYYFPKDWVLTAVLLKVLRKFMFSFVYKKNITPNTTLIATTRGNEFKHLFDTKLLNHIELMVFLDTTTTLHGATTKKVTNSICTALRSSNVANLFH